MLRIPQSTMDGNMMSIYHYLKKRMGFSDMDFTEFLIPAGGDQVFSERIRTVQMLKEGDIPCENFSFIVPLLGMLYCLMCQTRVILEEHLEESDSMDPSTLRWMNGTLSIEDVDVKATKLWAALELIRRGYKVATTVLMLGESGSKTVEVLKLKILSLTPEGCMETAGIEWKEIVERIGFITAGNYVDAIRRRPDWRRDLARENMLLFVRHVNQACIISHESTPQFQATGAKKYAREMLEIRYGIKIEWTLELRRVVRHAWVISPWGRLGHFLALDEMQEELIRALKVTYNSGGVHKDDDFQRTVVAPCVVYLISVKNDVREAFEVKPKGALIRKMMSMSLGIHVEGRGFEDREKVYKESIDLFSVGMEKLRNGKVWLKFLQDSVTGEVEAPMDIDMVDVVDYVGVAVEDFEEGEGLEDTHMEVEYAFSDHDE
ncbi:hypothetical protein L211DRAFT_854149 [Terfezia boudieri ATCC MYA-4762]|uniref:DUF6589 domain-containing protein n=1 Tax=Terfezia boudieri ATCC MYA-4762 TaxID=1051890 RepID=A0A3N4L742_9PEZI|nr:hypothetical protein L211DRAFT_854149 [Terfezia boudieri ATCC MYA-4762]